MERGRQRGPTPAVRETRAPQMAIARVRIPATATRKTQRLGIGSGPPAAFEDTYSGERGSEMCSGSFK
ncbi:hypothetical protein MHYP_G00176660 [Metynnis hypsauchen]